MPNLLPITDSEPPRRIRRGGAFTLIELMVAVSLLTVIILSIGVVFKSTGNAVGLGQATGEMFAKVRAINQQLTADVHGIDRNGFLIIRCQYEKAADPDYQLDRRRRYDQISFISTGKFPNRTGSYQSANIFADNTTSSAARIWYGQLLVQKDGASNEGTTVPVAAHPNSLVGPRDTANADYGTSPFDSAYESGFILGRQAMLLLNPTNAASFPAGYLTINNLAGLSTSNPACAGASDQAHESSPISITASRIAVAYTTVPQIIASLNGLPPNPSTYCYRLKTLPSPTATAITDTAGTSPFLPNGVFRMHPIFAPGVPSFAVDWTDGLTDANGNVQWYGLNNGTANSYNVDIDPTAAIPPNFSALLHSSSTYGASLGSPAIEHTNLVSGDNYEAVFDLHHAKLWPKALRFTYRITDSNDRLNGGRSFVCIVDLP